jgi:glycosyltransferase involved in cell wall biosynthesis
VVVYAPFAGALYGAGGAAGGAELQAFTIARSLALAGLRVRHIVTAAGTGRTVEGVEVVQLSPEYERRGLPGRRAVIRALREADGSVYIQRSAGIDTGFIGLFARAAGRRAIFSASSDGDFATDKADWIEIGSGLDQRPVRMLYRIGLRAVHAVVAQTEQQAELARRGFRLHPVVIPSFCALASRSDATPEAVLWIGSLTAVKDPLAYVTLAERLPEVPFWMIAHEHPSGWRELAATVRARAASLPNLELLSRRPREALSDLYARAIAIVNTSRHEGFPNTFLEGWARGVPAVSLRIDPDGVIARHGIGGAAGGSLDAAAQMIRRYFEDPSAARADGEAGQRYIAQTHAPEVVTASWLSLVERLAGMGANQLS